MEQVERQYEFHRLARSWPQYRWWKPLLTALLGVAIYLGFSLVLLVIGAITVLATSADVEKYLDAAAAIDLSDPVIFAFTLVSLILMIPALALASLIVGPRPIGLLSSVAGRIRWRWLAVCAMAATGVFLASLAVSTAIGFFFPEESAPVPVQPETSTLVIMLALSILAVPFQAAAEEYVFRGFLMQMIGSWLRHPAFAILLPVPLFVLGHGYDPLGQTDVAVFAVFAGWISWRTGGLEAAIAVHAINNMTIFILGAFGLVDVNSTEGSVSGLIVSGATMAVTALVIIRLADRRGIARTRTVADQPVLQPGQPLQSFQPGQPGQPFHPFQPGQPGQPFHPFQPGQPFPTAQAPGIPASGPYAPAAHGTAPASSGPVQNQPRQMVQSLPGAYDPSQYDPARYASYPQQAVPPAPAPAARQHGTTEQQHDPFDQAPASRGVAPPPASTRPEPGKVEAQPTTHDAAPSERPPSSGGRDYSADRHPSGPAHPAGPGYPPGTPHPAGPGYPGADASSNPDRENGTPRES